MGKFEELIEMNEDYKLLMDDYPEFFLIGKDAADTGYAIHKTNGTYTAFGLMSNRETDGFDFVAESFEKFLENISGIK